MNLDIRQLALEQVALHNKVKDWERQVNLKERLAECKSEDDVNAVRNELVGMLCDDEGQIIDMPGDLFVTFILAKSRFK